MRKETLHPLVILYLFTVVIPIGFNIGSVAITTMRLLLMATIVPMSVNLFSGKYGKVYPIDYLFYVHIIWASLALIVNNPGLAVQNIGSFSVEFLGGYTLARAYIRTPATFIALIRMILLLVLFALPFAVSEALNGRAAIPYWIGKIPGLWSVAQVNIEKRMGLERVQVYFAHPIHFGLFCSSVLALTFVSMRGIVSNFARYALSMAICLGVFLSLSSGALLAAILQMSLVAWAFLLRRNEARWKILIGIFVFLYVAIDLASNRTPLRVFMTYATFSSQTAYYRSIIVEWGMINVWANPFLGLGLNNWVRPGYMKDGSMDNFWLVMAVRYGIPGFLTVALGYADALYRVGRRRFAPGSQLANMKFGWMVVFVGLSFTLYTVHIWTAMYSYVFFLLGAGVWMADATDDAGQGEAVADAAERKRRVSYSRGPAAGPVHAREVQPSHARSDIAENAATDAEQDARRSPEVFTRFSDREKAGPAQRFARERDAAKYKR
ncbi:MAG TPA: O-antigen ligase family protein [Albidovulum sp.]|uniref:O-antigen ligase family protein n=1 Tax=Albidovulum sp. TaxID=1872424 RepID=UPI002D153B0A|nr:O-antigen ligase family protein [Albidovulum sp.]